jgi:hypothetical protein
VLENKVVYTEPVNDPWFKATTRDLNRNTAVWKADKAAGVIGCVETYEFCNKTSCLKPLSIPVREEYFPGLETLNLNEKQKATFWYLRKAALYGRAYLPPMLLQDELLRAREQVFQDPIYGGSGISVALPDNQWEIEVDNLFNTSLSFLQHMSVEHVSQSNIRITPNATLRDFIQKENYTGAEIVCNSQMIRSTSYSSLKVIGLGCILGIGSFFMVLSLLLPIIMPLVYKWYKARLCRQEVEWQGNDLFQLLLRAFEGCGVFERTLSGKALVPPEPNKEFKLPWVEEIEQSARSREGVTRRNTFGGDTAIDEQRGEIASIETHESSESTAVVHTLPQQSEEITLQTPTGPRSTHNP